MFLKDETLLPKAEKNIRMATSKHLKEGYSEASEPISPDWVEGPTTIKIKDNRIVYFDRYTQKRMGAIMSADLKNWTDISDKINFPEGTRHGSVFEIEKSVLTQMKSILNNESYEN
jgi:hypothetical protein